MACHPVLTVHLRSPTHCQAPWAWGPFALSGAPTDLCGLVPQEMGLSIGNWSQGIRVTVAVGLNKQEPEVERDREGVGMMLRRQSLGPPYS